MTVVLEVRVVVPGRQRPEDHDNAPAASANRKAASPFARAQQPDIPASTKAHSTSS